MKAAGIEYMLTGSLASSVQGEPRATHDIDFVVEIAPHQVHALVAALPEGQFYLDSAYMDLWAERIGVKDSLARIRSEAQPL